MRDFHPRAAEVAAHGAVIAAHAAKTAARVAEVAAHAVMRACGFVTRRPDAFGRLSRAVVMASCAALLHVAGCAPQAQPGETTDGDTQAPATAGRTQDASTSGGAHGGLRFTDVTQDAGLGEFRHETGAEGDYLFPESMGSGCGYIDYDGDGWIDILAAGGGTWPRSTRSPVPAVSLYRNDGDGTFTLANREARLDGITSYSFGFAVADFDNDGDDDFYLTNVGENMLFRNDGGYFTEVAAEAGVAGASVWSTSPLFFDADRDGHLDLYVGNYVVWTPETDLFCTLDGETKDYCTPQAYEGLPGRFYRNNGDGTFTDRTQDAGFHSATGKALGAIELDFNRDGHPDVMVANDTDPNQLFVNNGDGTFTERARISGVAVDESGKTRAGMGIDAGVVDSTGEVSIFVGHFTREMIGVWRHQRDGIFIDRSAVSKVGRPSLQTLTFGLFLFDADLDGHLDLLAANGHINPRIATILEGFSYAEPVHLFLNRGDATFEDAAPRIGGVLRDKLVARGAAYADFDRDGDLDILISENSGGLHLWRNDLNTAGYLRVHVEGRAGNRSALGTRLVALTGTRRMERLVTSGASYLSASEQVATFGLGRHDAVDSLVVYWPSGRIDRWGSVLGGQDMYLIEGAARSPNIQ